MRKQATMQRVNDAVEALQAEGKAVTCRAVREWLGGGSLTTVGKALRDLRERKAGQAQPDDPLTEIRVRVQAIEERLATLEGRRGTCRPPVRRPSLGAATAICPAGSGEGMRVGGRSGQRSVTRRGLCRVTPGAALTRPTGQREHTLSQTLSISPGAISLSRTCMLPP